MNFIFRHGFTLIDTVLGVGEWVFCLGTQAGLGGSVLQSSSQFAAVRAKS